MSLEVRSRVFYGVEITDECLYTDSKKLATCEHKPNLMDNFCPKCGKAIVEDKIESPHYDSDYEIFHDLKIVKENQSKRKFLAVDYLEVFQYNAVESVSVLDMDFRPDICRETIMKKLPKEIWDRVQVTFKLYSVLQII